MSQSNFTVVGLCAGAGGLDLGTRINGNTLPLRYGYPTLTSPLGTIINGNKAKADVHFLEDRLEGANLMNDRAKKVWENYFGDKTRGQDVCGAWIKKEAYGDVNSQYGWEIDHKVPLSKNGTDALSNLRPLHVLNNDAKGDKLDGYWTCTKRN